MTLTMNSNGQQRKTLAAQIDRLDTMLDSLADSLNEAIAHVVRDAVALAVQEAVRAVLTEAMTNPVVVARLRAAAPMAEQEKVSEKPSLGRRLASGWSWLVARCRTGLNLLRVAGDIGPMMAVRVGKAALMQTRRKIDEVRERCRPLWHVKFQLVAALAVAGGLGVAGFFAGPTLAAASSAVCGFVATLAVQTGLWLRRQLIRALNGPTPVKVLQA